MKWSPLTVVSLASVAALVALAGVNLAWTAEQSPPVTEHTQVAFPDMVVASERLFAGAHAALSGLPPRTAVGYYAGVEAPLLANQPNGTQDYFLAQFAVLPVVLDTTFSKQDLVLANLSHVVGPVRFPEGYAVQRDFGNRTYLLKRSAR